MADEYKEFLEFKAFQQFKAAKAAAAPQNEVVPIVAPKPSFASIAAKPAASQPPPSPPEDDAKSVATEDQPSTGHKHKTTEYVQFSSTNAIVRLLFSGRIAASGTYLFDTYKVLYQECPERFTVESDIHTSQNETDPHISVSVGITDRWHHNLHIVMDYNEEERRYKFSHLTVLENRKTYTIAKFLPKP